jgi:DNA-binding Xre family transcriptional regulator
MNGDRVPDLGEELAVIPGRNGRPGSVIVPIAAWDALPNEVREGLRADTDVEFAVNGDRRCFAIVRWQAYEQIREDIEDTLDGLAFDRAREAHEREGGGTPIEVVQAIEEGRHPIAAWRKHRKMRQADLAGAAGIERSYLSHLESGTRQGTPDTLAHIARALGCRVEDLIAEPS